MVADSLTCRAGRPIRVEQARTIGCLWMRCCGSRRRELPGVICRTDSATGIPSSNAITVGANGAFGSGSWKLWVGSPTWSICCWIPPLCEPTSMRLAQKGGEQRSVWAFSRRLEHENPRWRRQEWLAGSFFPDRRRAARYGGGGNTDRKPFGRLCYW